MTLSRDYRSCLWSKPEVSSPVRCFIIAEIGVNHNGDMDIARRLIDAAADAGADAAKVQTFKTESLILKGTETVDYQKANSGHDDQFDLLKSLELRPEQHHDLVRHCSSRNIEFMSTAFDLESLKFLLELGIARIKIPSGEITNTPLVELAAGSCLPLIISTGMATLVEVAECVRTARAVWSNLRFEGDLCVLHCTTAYPTELFDVNLAAMRTMESALSEAVGYSDHTAGILLPPLAVAAGARVIEKHITLDRTMSGPDHAASIEPMELSRMVADIRQVEDILGDGVKAPKPIEMETRALVRKGLKFARDLPAGHVVSLDDLVSLRPETGLPPSWLKRLVGRQLKASALRFVPVRESDFE